jgi:hypothetical protein
MVAQNRANPGNCPPKAKVAGSNPTGRASEINHIEFGARHAAQSAVRRMAPETVRMAFPRLSAR